MKRIIIPIFLAIPFLGIANQSNEDYSYENTNSATPAFSFSNEKTTAESLRVSKAIIVGRWENSLDAVEADINGKSISGGFLKYIFRENGTYSKVLGGAEVSIEEAGRWEVSEDGKQLLMYSTQMLNGQLHTVTEVANIKYLQMDEMVLEQHLRVADEQFSSEKRDFYFNKY